MSTMPAEGNQPHVMELMDLTDHVPKTPVSMANSTNDPVPCLLNMTGDVTSGQQHGKTNRLKEEDELLVRPSTPTPPIVASAVASSANLCQGTAHFYQQSTERLAHSTSWNSSQANAQVNGARLTSRDGLEGGRTGRGCNTDTSDEWPIRPVSLEGDILASASSCWQSTNGCSQTEPAQHLVQDSRDDMENYFNANAHMFAYLDIQSGAENVDGEAHAGAHGSQEPENPKQNSIEDRSGGGCYHNGYGSDDGIIVNGSLSSLMHNSHLKLSTSSDEFIETDMILPVGDIESSIRCSSSEEDLQTLTFPPGSRCQQTHSNYNSDSTQRPREGPKLLPPVNSANTHSLAVCEYKKGSSADASRPASIGVLNRLCTCSVVSYSRRRPLAPSNQSSSDLDADEGVGGMKASPAELSPVDDSDMGQACGITVTTSDSSSYFSPEDVDFLGFDPVMPDANKTSALVETDSNTNDSVECLESKSSPDISHQLPETRDPCGECGKSEQHCLCVSLHACKQLLEDANAHHQNKQSTTTTSTGHNLPDNSSNGKVVSNVSYQMLDDEQMVNPYCTYCTGRDSGSGSQEHLDALSYDDQDEDDRLETCRPVPPLHQTCPCMCLGCGEEEFNHHCAAAANHSKHFSGDDTNNLDVEVFSAAPSSDYEDELFNVSRQTSTSNFDQDENAYQDAVEDCASNGFHSACSGSDLESEKSNHIVNQSVDCLPECATQEDSLSGPPEIPLPIPARSQDQSSRLPPRLPPCSPLEAARGVVPNMSGCSDCGGAEQPSWMMATGRLPSPRHGPHPPHWVDFDLPLERLDLTHRRPSCREDRSMAAHSDGDGGDNIQDPIFPDPLPDIFILNLLREKESRAHRVRATVEKMMIWNEYEAYVLQVKQIGVSACGATAVINVLKAFNLYVDKALISAAIKTNIRAEKAPLAEYLLSRSIAGCTAEHLITGMESVTNGDVTGRFFCFYPERDVDICHWLGMWMKKGAVAVMTLNLQRAVPQGWAVPDAWHHQMVYGVGPKGIYLTNPLEIVPEDVIREQLTSPSELLIQRKDVISGWTSVASDTDLTPLLTQPDARWRQLNVIGQVVNVLREASRPRVLGFPPQLTPHMRIPAWYRPGVTLFVRSGSDVHQELLNAPPLPLSAVPSGTTSVKDSPLSSTPLSQSSANSLERPLTTERYQQVSSSSNTIQTSRSLDEAGMSSSDWPPNSLHQQARNSFDQSVSSFGQSANSLDRLASSSGLSASSSGQFTCNSDRATSGSSSDHHGSSSSWVGAWNSEPSTSTAKQKADESPDADVMSSMEEMQDAEDGFEDYADDSAQSATDEKCNEGDGDNTR